MVAFPTRIGNSAYMGIGKVLELTPKVKLITAKKRGSTWDKSSKPSFPSTDGMFVICDESGIAAGKIIDDNRPA